MSVSVAEVCLFVCIKQVLLVLLVVLLCVLQDLHWLCSMTVLPFSGVTRRGSFNGTSSARCSDHSAVGVRQCRLLSLKHLKSLKQQQTTHLWEETAVVFSPVGYGSSYCLHSPDPKNMFRVKPTCRTTTTDARRFFRCHWGTS